MARNYVALKAIELLTSDISVIIQYLKDHHRSCMNQPASNSQAKAWENSITILRKSLEVVLKSVQNFKDILVVFEYELPRERGRRPDVLLLMRTSIVVIEFKQSFKIERAFIDQVSAYARDLNHYHEHSHEIQFRKILLMASHKEFEDQNEDVYILSPDRLHDLLIKFWEGEKNKKEEINYSQWLEGDYAPLPSLVQAARIIFQHKPLPSIRRASSAGIPETLRKLHSIAKNAKRNNEHHLALITGVPGAGKTLVGISFVYDAFNNNEETNEAVLLSGNGPLVEVLKYALSSSVFVQDVHGFLKRYGGDSLKTPRESIFIYDEAQRAWDKEKVNDFRGHLKSEPEDFLEIGKKKDWCLMIGLIGEGQEIHLGEESGIEQWNEAIASKKSNWKVTCPSKLSKYFYNAASIEQAEELNLSESLRSHLAEDVQIWINELLQGNFINSKKVSSNIKKQQFEIYITRNLANAKGYVTERYYNEHEKRFGLLASSKGQCLPNFGVMNDFLTTRKVKKGPWYIDEKESHLSCCQMKDVMTEFGCQGLELDFPIVCWGDDFIWNGKNWEATKVTRGAKNSFQLRKNSYRVLLSRGRDGMLIFVPEIQKLNMTYNFLKSCGIEEL